MNENTSLSNKSIYNYGIIGDGRMARHFAHYLTLLDIPYKQWSRKSSIYTNRTPQDQLDNCNIILILIKDSEIENFIKKNPFLRKKQCIHFSGSLTSMEVESFYPLMTFGEELYDLKTYESVPFIINRLGPSFKEVFPHFSNPYYEIDENLKPLLHAFCVMSGNFTFILWEKFIKEAESTLKLPKAAIEPYLRQTLENIKNIPKNTLTGPLARRDYTSIQKNMNSLRDDPFLEIYKAFVNLMVPDISHAPKKLYRINNTFKELP